MVRLSNVAAKFFSGLIWNTVNSQIEFTLTAERPGLY